MLSASKAGSQVDPLCPHWDPHSLQYPNPGYLYNLQGNALSAPILYHEEAKWTVHHRIFRALQRMLTSADGGGFLELAKVLHKPPAGIQEEVVAIREHLMYPIYGSTKSFIESMGKSYFEMKHFRPTHRDWTMRELEEELGWDRELNFLYGLELMENLYLRSSPEIMEMIMMDWMRKYEEAEHHEKDSWSKYGESEHHEKDSWSNVSEKDWVWDCHLDDLEKQEVLKWHQSLY